jgi:hypothetical protein
MPETGLQAFQKVMSLRLDEEDVGDDELDSISSHSYDGDRFCWSRGLRLQGWL